MRTKRALILLLAAICLTVPAAASCDFGPGPTPSPTPPPTAAPTPSPGGPTPTATPNPYGGTLTVRLKADVSTLNPWLAGNDQSSQMVAGLIFSGLTRLDNKLMPQPDLADRWDVSEDGTLITFHLRSGITWHDGQPVTPDDVVWSYRTLMSMSASTAALIRIQDTVLAVDPGDPGSDTVKFSLKRRSSPLLADLAMPVLPSHILSGTTPDQLADSPFNSAPVGSGPFAFEKRDTGQSITLKASDRYYAGRPFIDRVAFLVAPQDDVAATAIGNGTLMLGEFPPDAAEKLVTSGSGVRGGSYDETGFDFVAFNLRAPHPFSDTRLRQAWALALDKPGLVYQAAGSSYDPVWSDVNKASWAYNPSVPKLSGDPTAARKLLADAGWVDTNGDGIVEKGGHPLEVSLYVRADSQTLLKTARAMGDPLKRVGIRVVVEPADFKTSLLTRVSPTGQTPFDFDVLILGWSRYSFDPDDYLLFHSSQIPTPAAPALLNFTGFQAPEYDTLLINARSSYDFDQRAGMYRRMQEIIADQLPYYYLWSQKFGVVAGPKLVGNIDFGSPLYMWNVAQWRIAK